MKSVTHPPDTILPGHQKFITNITMKLVESAVGLIDQNLSFDQKRLVEQRTERFPQSVYQSGRKGKEQT